MPHQEIQLHDIKPLLEVPDYSFYYFMALVVAGSAIVLGLLYLLLHRVRSRKRVDIRKEHAKKLRSVKLKDVKKAAYDISRYGATFQNESERHQKIYHELFEALEPYKYKKDVPKKFDANTLRLIELYRGMIDV